MLKHLCTPGLGEDKERQSVDGCTCGDKHLLTKTEITVGIRQTCLAGRVSDSSNLYVVGRECPENAKFAEGPILLKTTTKLSECRTLWGKHE